jgi:hypothetical protein
MDPRWYLLVAALAAPFLRTRPPDIPFEKRMLDWGANETCALADLNGDGRLDIVSGENWFEAPRWVKHRFREIPFVNNYVDVFSDLPLDVNARRPPGRGELLVVRPPLAWWENPGGRRGLWKDHTIDSGFPGRILLPGGSGQRRARLASCSRSSAVPEAPLAWYELRNGAFVKHVAYPSSFGHGIGAGDVNGDGRTDIVTPKGWLEAPPDPRSGPWTLHADFELGNTGFIHVLDVNGDGRNDLLTSLAHDYGIFWMERSADGRWTRRT